MRLDHILSALSDSNASGLYLSNLYAIDFFPGDHGGEVTRVPIPNTTVKSLSGDGTVGYYHGRVARRRDSIWSPEKSGLFFFLFTIFNLKK